MNWQNSAVTHLITSMPQPVVAHVKWFVLPADPARPRVDWSLVFSARTAIFIIVAAVALGLMYALQQLVGDPHWPGLRFFEPLAVGAPTLLAVQTAITLVYAAAQPAIFVPNIPLPLNVFGVAVAAVEFFIAFTFITGIADWTGAIGLILLVPLSLYRRRWFDTLDMLFWVGIGIVILAIGRSATDASRVRPQLPPWVTPRRAVAALRVITGVAITAPAFSEKIWNPRIGTLFLQEYPNFNFMRRGFGLSWFSDSRFVLCAGVAEATIGILLISGFLPRVVILGAWLPFNLGIPFLPPQELIGHLPILGIVYFLLVHSAKDNPVESADQKQRVRRVRIVSWGRPTVSIPRGPLMVPVPVRLRSRRPRS